MRGAWAAVVCAAVGLALFALAGCGRAGAPVQDCAAVGSVDAAQPPAGVDAALYARLYAAMQRQLPPRSGSSSVPLGEASRVQDFKLQPTGDQTVLASWSYRNPGDYNLDGKVAADDLAVLARYFGAKRADAAWPMAGVADGNGDGVVGEGDVAPVAANFGHSISGYYIQRTGDLSLSEPWVYHAAVLRQAGQKSADGARLEFEVELTPVKKHEYYSLLPYHISAQGLGYGLRSNTELYSGLVYPPPAPENLTATNGARQDFVHLSWDPAPGATAYNVYRDGNLLFPNLTELASDPEGNIFFDDYSVPDGDEQIYAVSATNKAGEGERCPAVAGSIMLPDSASTGAGEWPMYAHDVQHTFQTRSTGPDVLKLAWSKDLDNSGAYYFSAPVSNSDGVGYSGYGYIDSSMYDLAGIIALTPAGQELWRMQLGYEYCLPLVGMDGTIYAAGSSRRYIIHGDHYDTQQQAELYAISPNREVVWSVKLADSIDDKNTHSQSLIQDEQGRLYWVISPNRLIVVSPEGVILAVHDLPNLSFNDMVSWWNPVSVDHQGHYYLLYPDYYNPVLMAFLPSGTSYWESKLETADPVGNYDRSCIRGALVTPKNDLILQGFSVFRVRPDGQAYRLGLESYVSRDFEYSTPALMSNGDVIAFSGDALRRFEAASYYGQSSIIRYSTGACNSLVDSQDKIYILDQNSLACIDAAGNELWVDHEISNQSTISQISMANDGTLFTAVRGKLTAYSPD